VLFLINRLIFFAPIIYKSRLLDIKEMEQDLKMKKKDEIEDGIDLELISPRFLTSNPIHPAQ